MVTMTHGEASRGYDFLTSPGYSSRAAGSPTTSTPRTTSPSSCIEGSGRVTSMSSTTTPHLHPLGCSVSPRPEDPDRAAEIRLVVVAHSDGHCQTTRASIHRSALSLGLPTRALSRRCTICSRTPTPLPADTESDEDGIRHCYEWLKDMSFDGWGCLECT